jgi:hypothetical protein
MLQACDSLVLGRRTIVSMPECCTAYQVEKVYSNRMLKEIRASYMFRRDMEFLQAGLLMFKSN